MVAYIFWASVGSLALPPSVAQGVGVRVRGRGGCRACLHVWGV